jgi:threonine/homoserine/homoserine lactone efflux protein
VITQVLTVAAIFCLYLLPTLIASQRKHKSAGSILVVNLCFGWTVLAWILCIAWACSGNVEAKKENETVAMLRELKELKEKLNNSSFAGELPSKE